MAETCFVFGCNAAKDDTVSVHVLPKDLQLREKWVQFIWKNRNVPDKLPEKTRICSSHFPERCFENFTQKQMGFATKLMLKPDAVPSIYPGDTASTSLQVGLPLACFPGKEVHCFLPHEFTRRGEKTRFRIGLIIDVNKKPRRGQPRLTTIMQAPKESIEVITGIFSQTLPAVRHVACQTDPPETRPLRSVGTQLSMKTLQSHFRSTATQAKTPSRDCGVCTPTFPLDSPLLLLQPTVVKTPSKRPRLTDEEDGP